MNEKGGGGCGSLHTNLIACYLAKRHLNIFHISPFPSMWREGGGGRIVLHQIVVKEGRTPAFHLLPAPTDGKYHKEPMRTIRKHIYVTGCKRGKKRVTKKR